MKIKIQEKKQNINEFFGLETLAAVTVGAVFGYLAKKFFSPAKKKFVEAGNQIETATKEMEKALKNDEEPQAQTISQRIVSLKQKLVSDLKEIEEKAQDAEKASQLQQKPSVMVKNLIEQFDNEIERLTVESELNKQTQEVLRKASARIDQSLKTIDNIDKVMLLANKKDPKGLWISGMKARTGFKAYLNNEKNWNQFVEIISTFINNSQNTSESKKIFKLKNNIFIISEEYTSGDMVDDFQALRQKLHPEDPRYKPQVVADYSIPETYKPITNFFKLFLNRHQRSPNAKPTDEFIETIEEVINWGKKNNILFAINMETLLDSITMGL